MAAKSSKPSMDIRTAIQTLTSILSIAGIPKISSEVFRKAKFNHSSARKDVLKLLYNVCELVSQLKCRSNLPRIEELKISLTVSISDKWMLLLVQKYLHYLGYDRTKFYITSDSSRELLMAFGWLVLQYNVIQQLQKATVYTLNTPIIPLAVDSYHAQECISSELDDIKASFDNRKEIDVSFLLNKVMWLKGVTEKECKTVDRLMDGFHQIQSRLKQFTHLSLCELYLKRYPEKMAKYLRQTEEQVAHLKHFIDWSDGNGSDVFSMWLVSVFELTVQEDTTVQDDVTLLSREIDDLQKSVRTLKLHSQHIYDRIKVLSKRAKEPDDKLETCIPHCFGCSSSIPYVYCSEFPEGNCMEQIKELKESNTLLRNSISKHINMLQQNVPSTIMTLQFL